MEEARPTRVGRAALLLHQSMDGDEMAEVRLAGVLHLLDPLAEEEGRHLLVARVVHGGLRACVTPIVDRGTETRGGTGPDRAALPSLSPASGVRKPPVLAALGEPVSPRLGPPRPVRLMSPGRRPGARVAAVRALRTP